MIEYINYPADKLLLKVRKITLEQRPRTVALMLFC